MPDVRVKICGLTRAEDVAAAADAGAAYLGFVFFPKSPRNVSVDQARALAVDAPFGVAKVGLLVDPDDALLDEIAPRVPLDMIQLHGRETPERVAEVRARMGLPVMKALGVATEADLEKVAAYGRVADQLLIDAKRPKAQICPAATGWPSIGAWYRAPLARAVDARRRAHAGERGPCRSNDRRTAA